MNDRSTVSWRRHALLWPAICCALASIFAVLWVAALGGSTTTWGSILAVSARVPIAVVVSVFAFGIVATLASSIYARDLFADVPAPIDWDREV
ncbi:hypothetical protein [Rhodococcus sp. MEB064]|uniref:hypothetical protein n=1 Tax=Rhodococcus sp. MEB064 TaxID=1587522 RepID=UPI0005ABFF83|nr:hypothetical protein [Rhodococcus sp. MEB064]KIQ07983.1 hypothetical protein RU01_21370 [Rhodococcus sp. MEB064]